MAIDGKASDRKAAAMKLASAKLLLAKLQAAHQNGTLRPVSSAARPRVQAIRVKAA